MFCDKFRTSFVQVSYKFRNSPDAAHFRSRWPRLSTRGHNSGQGFVLCLLLLPAMATTQRTAHVPSWRAAFCFCSPGRRLEIAHGSHAAGRAPCCTRRMCRRRCMAAGFFALFLGKLRRGENEIVRGLHASHCERKVRVSKGRPPSTICLSSGLSSHRCSCRWGIAGCTQKARDL